MSQIEKKNPKIQNDDFGKYQNGLLLKEPHASWIYLGVKDSIVSTENYSDLLGETLILVGERAYGSIKLNSMNEVDINYLTNNISSHRITNSERKNWSKENKNWLYGPFYSYSFEFTPFDIPMTYDKNIFGKSIISGILLKEEVEDDFIYKPKGPWGDGFKECEEWVKRNKPEISDPKGYCAEIYHRQNKKKEDIEKLETVDIIPYCDNVLDKEAGKPKTDIERVLSHYNMTMEEWNKLPPEKKRELLNNLPERGTRVDKDDDNDPCPCEKIIIKYTLEERPSGFYLLRHVGDTIEKELKFSKPEFVLEEVMSLPFVKELLEEQEEIIV